MGGNPRGEPNGREPKRGYPNGGKHNGGTKGGTQRVKPKWGTQSAPKMLYFIVFPTAEESREREAMC